MRPGDPVCSDWFEVDQGLRQGYLLSLLLFKIFFAAVLTAVLQILSEDTVILAELKNAHPRLNELQLWVSQSRPTETWLF